MSDDKYYDKKKFVCHECGKEWDTPGAAESCYNTHELNKVLQRVHNHDKLFIEDVIDAIEQMVLAGEFDDERMIESQERIQERRKDVFDGDANQLRGYIQKLEDAIREDWQSEGVGENVAEACEWRTKDLEWTWPR